MSSASMVLFISMHTEKNVMKQLVYCFRILWMHLSLGSSSCWLVLLVEVNVISCVVYAIIFFPIVMVHLIHFFVSFSIYSFSIFVFSWFLIIIYDMFKG